MEIEVKIPSVGESITDGIIGKWNKQNGDFVQIEELLFELETDKITMPVKAKESGILKILVEEGQTVKIGQVVAIIEVKRESEAPKRLDKASQTAKIAETKESRLSSVSPPAGMEQVKAKLGLSEEMENLAPSVRRLLEENAISPSEIAGIGTGKGNRITKEDVLNYLEKKKIKAAEAPLPQESPTVPNSSSKEAKPSSQIESQKEPEKVSPSIGPELPSMRGQRQTRKPMTKIRQRIAERLVQAQQNAAILTTFNEVDMSKVMNLRTQYQEAFQKKHGIKLGLMSFFLKASVEALKSVPQLNAQIDGNDLVYNHYYDIGVAISTEHGLVVPVVRDVDKLSFAQIEIAIADYAKKAKDRSLTLDDLSGGVFTVSNGGVFGSLLSTPILNPPQSGILGMHSIKKRPVVVDETKIEIRPMMYLALSYDHRIIDGAEAVTFLRRIVECIENPERMMLGL